jgi:hypothetical protein
MTILKKKRMVTDIILADDFLSGDAGHRADALRMGNLSGLIQFGLRIAP